MTSTQVQPSPSISCPDWCESKHGDDWEQLTETGQLVRGHDFGDFPAVPHGGGYQTVSVYGFGQEYVDGTPIKFGIRIEAPMVDLTVEQALEVANSLTVLAERVQFIQHKIERDNIGQM